MKPIIIRNSWVPALLSLFMPIAAITLWPFVFVRRGQDSPQLINHESIHISQVNECWVLGFYGVYLWDWLQGLIKYRSLTLAYRNIRFEQEAYSADQDPDYLESRQSFAWRQYRV